MFQGAAKKYLYVFQGAVKIICVCSGSSQKISGCVFREQLKNICMCFQGAAERIRLVGAAEAGAAEARGRAEATLLT